MRSITDIQEDIVEVKKERKAIKKDYGKRSVVYAEATETLDELRNELDFTRLHT